MTPLQLHYKAPISNTEIDLLDRSFTRAAEGMQKSKIKQQFAAQIPGWEKASKYKMDWTIGDKQKALQKETCSHGGLISRHTPPMLASLVQPWLQCSWRPLPSLRPLPQCSPPMSCVWCPSTRRPLLPQQRRRSYLQALASLVRKSGSWCSEEEEPE